MCYTIQHRVVLKIFPLIVYRDPWLVYVLLNELMSLYIAVDLPAIMMPLFMVSVGIVVS